LLLCEGLVIDGPFVVPEGGSRRARFARRDYPSAPRAIVRFGGLSARRATNCGSISAEVVMLASLSGALRLALVLGLGAGVLTWDARQPAYAQSDDEEEDEDGGDDEGGGDDDGGGDEGEGEEEEEGAKDQPSVTAGGLFTIKTYPIRENDRPLTITQNLAQLRLGVGTDVSNKGAFESAGVTLEGLYGYTDNFMLLGGFTSAYNVNQFAVYGGFEGALAYDLIDFRLAARIGRTAIPELMDVNGMGLMPTGKYDSGDIKMAVDIGFPFRYVARPEIAIVALQSVMSIDFNSTDCADDGMGGEICGNEVKPDLNPSLAIVTNPIAPVSLVIQATLQVVDFDFTNNLKVPATARIQFSPNRKLDIGGEFTLLNVKPKDGEGSAFDNRFLSLFIASRFGK